MKRATKRDAVDLIKRAISQDWKRNVRTMNFVDRAPWYVQVSLTRLLMWNDGMEHHHGQIIISFTRRDEKSKRWSVQMETRCNHGKQFKGIWNAEYVLKQLSDASQIHAQFPTL